MAIGIAGSVAVASLLFALNWLGAGGLVATFMIGLAGAALAIGAQRTLWASPMVDA
jgi:hypothetical protein